jgi:hypothetical protein
MQLQRNAERWLVFYAIAEKRSEMVNLLCNCRETRRDVEKNANFNVAADFVCFYHVAELCKTLSCEDPIISTVRGIDKR